MDLDGLVALESVGDVTVKKPIRKKQHIHIDVSDKKYPVGAIAEVSKYLQKANVVVDSMWYEKGTIGVIYNDFKR